MKISDLLIVVILAFGVMSGMLAFMGDLSQSYDVAIPETLSEQTEGYARQINQTAKDIIDVGSSEGGWGETAYNIFFKLPSSMFSTLTGSVSTVTSFFSIIWSETPLIIPNWFIVMVGILISIVVAFTGLYFITGRDV